MSSAVDSLADNLKNASMQDNTAQDTVLASAAEGRRLYIGNLAYATTEAELTQFFSGYDVYVLHCIQNTHKIIKIRPASLGVTV